jgi:hypothetical protein
LHGSAIEERMAVDCDTELEVVRRVYAKLIMEPHDE